MPNTNGEYREGGWGWFVALACFLNDFVVLGTLKGFGILLTAVAQDLATELWIVGSITSVHAGVYFLLSTSHKTNSQNLARGKVGGARIRFI